VPYDEKVFEYDLKLKPLLELTDSSEAVMAVSELMDRLLNKSVQKITA
jgi:CO dehydrogenase nickel-insertion accessory protein CooC1